MNRFAVATMPARVAEYTGAALLRRTTLLRATLSIAPVGVATRTLADPMDSTGSRVPMLILTVLLPAASRSQAVRLVTVAVELVCVGWWDVTCRRGTQPG